MTLPARAGHVLAMMLLAAGPCLAQSAVRGVVRDKTGTPVAGATVMVEVSDMRVRRVVGSARATTDLSGVYTVRLDEFSELPRLGLETVVTSRRHRRAFHIEVVENKDLPLILNFELEPGGVLPGRVVTTDGEPVGGAIVRAEGLESVTTTARGDFELVGVPLGARFAVQVEKEGHAVLLERVPPEAVNGESPMVFVLTPAARLLGRVVAPDGSPLPHPTVRLQWSDRLRTTQGDAAGEFAFDQLPATMTDATVTAYAPGFLPIQRPVAPHELNTEARIELRATWPAWLAGTVMTPEGRPASGVMVVVGDGVGTRPIRQPVDERGQWRLGPLTPGQVVRVTAAPAQQERRIATGELEFLSPTSARVDPWPQGTRSQFDVTRDGNTLRLVRRDSGPGALPGKVVYTATLTDPLERLEGTVLVEETGATGTFTARPYDATGALEGTWDLREQIEPGAMRHAPVATRITLPPMAGTVMANLTLGRGLVLEGTVLDDAGVPARAGQVVLQSWDRARVLERRAPIQAGGRFRLEGMPEGVLELQYMDDGGRPVGAPVYTRAGIGEVVLETRRPEADPTDSITAPGGAP
jgi:hypothetical protein